MSIIGDLWEESTNKTREEWLARLIIAYEEKRWDDVLDLIETMEKYRF